jgi:hypothetical protein
MDDIYQIATDTQREAGPKIKQVVAAVHPEEWEYSEGDEEIAAFQRVPRTRKGRKTPIQRQSRPPKGTPPTTKIQVDQEAMPTEMANIAFTASYKITHKKIVLKESETKSRVQTDRVVLIGPECT